MCMSALSSLSPGQSCLISDSLISCTASPPMHLPRHRRDRGRGTGRPEPPGEPCLQEPNAQHVPEAQENTSKTHTGVHISGPESCMLCAYLGRLCPAVNLNMHESPRIPFSAAPVPMHWPIRRFAKKKEEKIERKTCISFEYFTRTPCHRR